MIKKRVVKFLMFSLNIIILLLLIWSLINYKILSKEVTKLVMFGGLTIMVIFVILLEGMPLFLGPSVSVLAILAMGVFNPWLILFLFILSALVGNVFYFYLGYFSGEKILKYFPKENVKKYKLFFKKYGRNMMIIMAISPIPYLPTIAGVFKMNSKLHIAETLIVRMLRHVVVFFFLFFVISHVG